MNEIDALLWCKGDLNRRVRDPVFFRLARFGRRLANLEFAEGDREGEAVSLCMDYLDGWEKVEPAPAAEPEWEEWPREDYPDGHLAFANPNGDRWVPGRCPDDPRFGGFKIQKGHQVVYHLIPWAWWWKGSGLTNGHFEDPEYPCLDAYSLVPACAVRMRKEKA